MTGGTAKVLSADILILKINKSRERKGKGISVYANVCQSYVKEILLNHLPKLSPTCFQT